MLQSYWWLMLAAAGAGAYGLKQWYADERKKVFG